MYPGQDLKSLLEPQSYGCSISTEWSQNNVSLLQVTNLYRYVLKTQSEAVTRQVQTSSFLRDSDWLLAVAEVKRGQNVQNVLWRYYCKLSLITFGQVSSCSHHNSDDEIQSMSRENTLSLHRLEMLTVGLTFWWWIPLNPGTLSKLNQTSQQKYLYLCAIS